MKEILDNIEILMVKFQTQINEVEQGVNFIKQNTIEQFNILSVSFMELSNEIVELRKRIERLENDGANKSS